MDIKEIKTPHLLYDIFGYFLPGFFLLCLIIIDFDFGAILKYYFDHGNSLQTMSAGCISYKMSYLFQFLTWNTDSDFKFTTVFILIIFCYLIGHIIAAVSSQVLEIWINNRFLGFPSDNLLDQGKRTWIQKQFKNYTKPFHQQFIIKFKEKFHARFGNINDRKAYYWLCFGEIAKCNPVAYSRIMHFLNLYGFSRNVSACFLTYSLIRLVAHWFTPIKIDNCSASILIVFVLIGLVMFKNYLKLFYRQCAELYYHFYTFSTSP